MKVEMHWTREQKQVIDSRNRNLLVSAAAGSGKTAVLVEHIIQMVSGPDAPMDIERLLVVTFTKAAASEMRERIRTAIEKKLEETPDDIHLQQQAVMVQYAQITTIDSFCLHILREHFDKLEIDPSFRVGDEGELLLLRTEVMEELLEEYYENGGERFEKFVDTYAIGKADGGIADYIFQVYAYSQSNPWPEEWMNQCRRELENTTIAELDQTEWMQFLLNDIKIQSEEWEEQLNWAILLCQDEDGPAPYLPMLCEDKEQIHRLTEASTFETLSQEAGSIVFSKLAAVRGENSPVHPEKKEAVAECRKRIKKAVEKVKEQYLFESSEQILADLEESKEAIFVLLELAEQFSLRFQKRKEEKNLVDFNDLEHFALKILTDEKLRRPNSTADEISAQYDEILVDEYQDSNLVQETLIKSISRERFGHPNVFMVGDVKQSIYKFRLARPELFLEKYRTYSGSEGDFQKIELHQNFRSRALVLESINQVFQCIMTEKLGGISYTEENALHAGAAFEKRDGLEELCTELLLVDTSEESLEKLDDDRSDYNARELEANMVALKIHQLVDEEKGLTVWDKERGCYRRARFGDIVILMRSVSGWAESFTEVLTHQGIPAFSELRTGYFDTPEVNTILNLLSVLDNPIQDIPLASVLKAPFVGITDEELAYIMSFYKRTAEKGRDRGLYGAAMNFLEEERKEQIVPGTEIGRKLERIFKLLKRLRFASSYLPLHELLYCIFEQTGYYDYVSAMPAGETRQANLDMLAEKAAAYESTSYRGVFQFIQYIKKLQKYNTDFGEASVTNEHGDTVRIMSIHKSKGLEFPIVIVAGLGKLFNKQDARGKILIDSDFGIGTDYLDSEKRLKGPTLKKNVLGRKMELEALGEELRVLYVAMTRAKEKLILTASDKNLESRLDKWSQVFFLNGMVPYSILTVAGSYLDWILMSLSGGRGLIKIEKVSTKQLLLEEMQSQIRKQVSKEALINFDMEPVYDKEYRELLTKLFSFSYPYKTDMFLNTKMSVSEIKRADQDLNEEAVIPEWLPTIPFFMEEKKTEEAGVSRGVAYHRVMELLPFSKMKQERDVKQFLEELCTSGKINLETRNMIWIPDIYRFLMSDLGKRMAEAEKKGLLFREKQFVIGIPAKEMGDWDSDELVLVQGVIDAYFEEEDGIVLVDYKTDYAETEDVLMKRYKTQLSYYERALSQMMKKTVKEKIIYSYRLGAIEL